MESCRRRLPPPLPAPHRSLALAPSCSLPLLRAQVTRHNLAEALPLVRQALADCQFFAIDCEMTGLFLEDKQGSYLDDCEDRYREVGAGLGGRRRAGGWVLCWLRARARAAAGRCRGDGRRAGGGTEPDAAASRPALPHCPSLNSRADAGQRPVVCGQPVWRERLRLVPGGEHAR